VISGRATAATARVSAGSLLHAAAVARPGLPSGIDGHHGQDYASLANRKLSY